MGHCPEHAPQVHSDFNNRHFSKETLSANMSLNPSTSHSCQVYFFLSFLFSFVLFFKYIAQKKEINFIVCTKGKKLSAMYKDI